MTERPLDKNHPWRLPTAQADLGRRSGYWRRKRTGERDGEIYAKYSAGYYTQADLADFYQLTQGAVAKIIARERRAAEILQRRKPLLDIPEPEPKIYYTFNIRLPVGRGFRVETLTNATAENLREFLQDRAGVQLRPTVQGYRTIIRKAERQNPKIKITSPDFERPE